MEIPVAYGTSFEKKVCELKRALYGLKQSLRARFERFAKVMISMGYRQSQGDHTLFINHSNLGGVTMLLMWMIS